MTTDSTKNSGVNQSTATDVQPWRPTITEKSLSRALQVEQLQNGKAEQMHVKHYCIWRGIDAARARYKAPCMDLGVGALDYLAAPILTTVEASDQTLFHDFRHATTSAALEAAVELSRVLEKHHLKILECIDACEKKLSDKGLAKKLATELRQKVQELSTPNNRHLTGTEFLDVIQYRRSLPPSEEQSRAEDVLIKTPPNQEMVGKKNKKFAISGTISARAGMTQLLKELGILSDENLELAIDWALNYGFGHFLTIKDVDTRRLILSGAKVHRSSERPRKTENTPAAENDQTKQPTQSSQGIQKIKSARGKAKTGDKAPPADQTELKI